MWRRMCVLGVWVALGCGAPEPPPAPLARHPVEALRWDFARYLPVAKQQRVAGVGGRGPSASASAEGELEQRAGSVLTYHFPLPAGSRFRGRATFHGVMPRDREEVVALTVVDESGAEFSLVRGSDAFDADAELELDWDLSEQAGRMARIHVRFDPGAADPDARLMWKNLWIEGSVPPQPPRPASPPRRGRYNVLLVLFDALRPDRTEPYGAEPPKTPRMQRLAERGVTFENAFSTAPWTSPSVASMLTGTHPTVHGVRGPPWSRDVKAPILPASLPTLPEILAQQGYETTAIINNPMIAPNYQFDRGFGQAYAYFTERGKVLETLRTPEAQADRVWDSFIQPTLHRAGDRPFFVYLHEIDPHNPYEPPPPWDEMYDPDYDGDLGRFTIQHIARYNAGAPLSPHDRRHVEALYQGEVSFMDAYLGRLLDRLAESGLEDDTLVVFTSDHGEGFGEHGLFGHGVTLHEEMIRIPLIVSLPGVLPEGRRVPSPFQLLDLAPTLLDLLGIDVPEVMQGYSLLPLLAEGDAASPLRPLFFRAFFIDRFSADGVRYGDWKLQRRNARLDGSTRAARYELFNLAWDPAEQRDRWSRNLTVGHTLRQMLEWQHHLDAQIEVVVDAEAPKPDPERIEQLRELGYVE